MNEPTPKWLREVQENSWNLELLISGGAILTLLQLPHYLEEWFATLRLTSQLIGRAYYILLGMFCIKILTIGFMAHLGLRAYWLSLVCINYIYPNGIQKHKIQWKKPFSFSVSDNETLKTQIIEIDTLCGILIYLSVLGSIVILGLVSLIIHNCFSSLFFLCII